MVRRMRPGAGSAGSPRRGRRAIVIGQMEPVFVRSAAATLVGLVLGGCLSGTVPTSTAVSPGGSPTGDPVSDPWPAAPEVPVGELDPSVAAATDRLIDGFGPGRIDDAELSAVAASGDARLAWLVADMLRFAAPGSDERALAQAFEALTSTDPLADDRFGTVTWVAVTNLLLGWDLLEPPGYRERKARLFLAVEPAWEPFFEDPNAAIDWRWVTWGGVLIDDREVGDGRSCRRGCIPALDDPLLTSAADGAWYADWRPVFGLVVGEEAVAFPRHIMEVHEMVNLTVGGRRVGLPYCTLCASAQAYLLDDVPGSTSPLVLRTSGLLSRSNKLMYDLETWSTFNTFTGRATSGPLHDANALLEQVTVTSTTWGAWKAAHPATRIVARDGGIGSAYPDDPLEGRDAAGPIFPTGPIDPRLPVHHRVIGVVHPDGTPIAFPVEEATSAIADGQRVQHAGVETYEDGGLRVRLVGGEELPAHEAFWFAWSQFHPETTVWSSVLR